MKINLLDEAISRKDEKLILELLDKGESPNRFGAGNTRALQFAIIQELSFKTIKKFLECGAKVNDKSGALVPLIEASARKKNKIIDLLLQYNANPDTKSCEQDGETALMYCIITKNQEGCILLLKAGADPMTRNGHGETAYDYARRHKLDEYCELMDEYS